MQNTVARIQAVDALAIPGLEKNKPEWTTRGHTMEQEATSHLPYWYVHDADKYQTLIAQNVAYIFKGDTILKYQKIGNYEEIKGEKEQ